MEHNQDTATGQLLSLKQAAERQNLLDIKTFDNLVQETDVSVVYEILQAFKGTLKECVSRLNEAEHLSAEDAYKVCHKLKGSALLLGFKALGDACVKAMVAVKEPHVHLPHASTNEVLRLAQDTENLVLKCVR